jgi:MFS transporter, ACS family, D-galactonate transporter
MNDVAKYGGLLFFMSAISATVSGKLADRWINAGATPRMARQGALTLGHVGIEVCLVLIPVTNGPLFVAMLVLTGIFLGLTGSNTRAVTQTLAGPHAAGRWAGVQNFVGNMADGLPQS